MKDYLLPSDSLLKTYQLDFVYLPVAHFLSMHSVISCDEFMTEQTMNLPIAIGRTTDGSLLKFDLAKAPHLLLSGADFPSNRDGAHYGINTIITSLLYKKKPSELKFFSVDKGTDCAAYRKIFKHFFVSAPRPDEEKQYNNILERYAHSLNYLVSEMNKRSEILSSSGCKTIEEFNLAFANEGKHLPYLVAFAENILGTFTWSRQYSKIRSKMFPTVMHLLERAHYVGIHLVFVEKYPKFDSITKELIQAIKTRVVFTMDEKDSRYFIGNRDANSLEWGNGDMIFYDNGNLTRAVAPYMEKSEVEAIIQYVREQCNS